MWPIRNDPRKNILEIAKEVRIATRTVNRKLSLLTEHRAFFLMGLPNFRRLAGTIGNFFILCSNGYSEAEKIVSRFKDTTFAAVSQTGLMCNISFRNLSEAEEAYEWIGRLEGVKKSRMSIMKDLIFVSDWIYYKMKRRLSEA